MIGGEGDAHARFLASVRAARHRSDAVKVNNRR
jgi:hypothetical protein